MVSIIVISSCRSGQRIVEGGRIHKASSQFKGLSLAGHRKGAANLVHRHDEVVTASATTRSCLRLLGDGS